MISWYEQIFNDIPLFAIPNTKNSDIIEYETNIQRNVRLLNKIKIKQEMKEIERLSIRLKI